MQNGTGIISLSRVTKRDTLPRFILVNGEILNYLICVLLFEVSGAFKVVSNGVPLVISIFNIFTVLDRVLGGGCALARSLGKHV